MLHENQLELGHILEVSSMDLLIQFAQVGLGIACVIKEFVQKELDDGTLVEAPLGLSFSPREIGFVCKKRCKGAGNAEAVGCSVKVAQKNPGFPGFSRYGPFTPLCYVKVAQKNPGFPGFFCLVINKLVFAIPAVKFTNLCANFL